MSALHTNPRELFSRKDWGVVHTMCSVGRGQLEPHLVEAAQTPEVRCVSLGLAFWPWVCSELILSWPWLCRTTHHLLWADAIWSYQDGNNDSTVLAGHASFHLWMGRAYLYDPWCEFLPAISFLPVTITCSKASDLLPSGHHGRFLATLGRTRGRPKWVPNYNLH